MGVTVIVPTYDNVEFLVDCINSIKQSFSECSYNDYEILLGIDNCQKTLLFLNDSKQLNDIRCFYFKKNFGPYVIKNSLVKEAKYDRLAFFDSDDLMRKEFIINLIKFSPKYPSIRFGFKNFSTDKELRENVQSITVADGVISINKDFFIKINGFYPWRCAADTEINTRINYYNYGVYQCQEHCFNRRMHTKNLTRRKETNFSSPIRKQYASEIAKLRKDFFPNPPILNTEEYIEIKFR